MTETEERSARPSRDLSNRERAGLRERRAVEERCKAHERWIGLEADDPACRGID